MRVTRRTWKQGEPASSAKRIESRGTAPRTRLARSVAALCLCCCGVCLSGISRSALGDEDEARAREFFEQRIRPILVDHCLDCHGSEDPAAKLRLDTRAGWQRGGERGPAIVPGDPTASLLIRAVSQRDAKLRMPPEDAGQRLSDRQIEDLTTWVRRGAYDPRAGERIFSDIELASREHWAFQPVQPPAVPADVHPIDFLIDRQLEQRGFVPTAPADMRTLVRRVAFDLHGLPPTAEQLATPREQFGQLVTDLLASPRYGERWGRHWLDVARYSDAKDGVLMYGDARIRPFAYTYRDYVIRALNDDKPFDQFIREQLAADQLGLPADSPDLAALGFLTLGRMFDGNRHDVIDDQIDVVTRGFLALTVTCARCHDHKFDPVPTADYYSLYGVFASCTQPYDRPRIAPITEEGQAFENELSAKLREIQTQQAAHYADTLRTARQRTPDYLVQVATTEPDVAETTIFFLSLTPEQLRPQITRRWRQLIARRAFPDDPVFGPWSDLLREAVLKPDQWLARGVDPRIVAGLVAASPQTPAEVARTYGQILVEAWSGTQQQAESESKSKSERVAEDDPLVALLAARDSPVWFPEQEVVNYLSRQPGDAFRGLLNELDAIAVRHSGAAARAMVVVDSDVLCDPVIFQRGDPASRGAPVPRQFLRVLSGEQRQAFPTGGGRLNLAESIASPDNPLTARVWVNRVWMHHFGEPLVSSPGDFGRQTPRPVQMELLDYLAAFFVRNGWRTKPLHELILSSRAYQRSSLIPHDAQKTRQMEADPGNTLVWHANRRRLDFEAMRDTLLAVSGRLDETMYGRPRLITDPANHRRTVYGFVERQNIPDMVRTFDVANADTSTSRRVATTVPQQALFALNSTFMLDAARALAERAASGQPAEQVRRLYQLAYGRDPSGEELQWGEEFLQSQPLAQFAQVLLMSNELMFVD